MIKMETFSELIHSGQAVLILWACALLLFATGIFSIIYVWSNLKITVKYPHFFAMQKMSGVMRTKAFYFGGLCLMIGSVCLFYAITDKGIAVPILLQLVWLVLFCGAGEVGKWSIRKLPIDRYLKSTLIGVILGGTAFLAGFMINRYYNSFLTILFVISIFIMWLDWKWESLTIRKYKKLQN